jgi:hypothetical protein
MMQRAGDLIERGMRNRNASEIVDKQRTVQ